MSSCPTEHQTAMFASSRQREVDDYFEFSASYWREIYERRGFEASLYRLRQEVVLELIDSLCLPAASRVLEVGCGAGRTATALGERGFVVDAIDSVDLMIRTAYERAECLGLLDRVRLGMGDVHQLAFRDACFDLVLAMGVAPWLDALDGPLKEMERVLKPGGRLLLSTDNRWCLNHVLDPRCFPALRPMRWRVRDALAGAGLCRPLDRPRLRWYSIQQVDALLCAAGLRKLCGRTLGFGPFSFLNVKLLSDGASLKLHRRLQSMADRSVPLLRSAGAEYVVIAEKSGSAGARPGMKNE